MTDQWTGQRIAIREGWSGANRRGTAIGEPVFYEQDWVPVKWDDEDDPNFHKRAGLVFVTEEENTDPWEDVRAYAKDRLNPDIPAREVRPLLRDADALLAAVAAEMSRAYDEWLDLEKYVDWRREKSDVFNDWLEHTHPDLAALPERLRVDHE